MNDVEIVETALVPGELLILFHHYCYPQWEQYKSPFYNSTIVKLSRMELIEPWLNEGKMQMPDGYRTTERGRVHVEALCKKALPEKRWVSS